MFVYVFLTEFSINLSSNIGRAISSIPTLWTLTKLQAETSISLSMAHLA
ncbi:hypothetical protein BN1723_001867 [Verticillium longisporum]|uniref:Uncharacterized protein n=1 Tax=Verticillium longisporum TaxID=100787 RepID=A0A0G4KRZ8_VERLO|nr:hypothetical protein BN1723_001867 [Verticillium longisporum]